MSLQIQKRGENLSAITGLVRLLENAQQAKIANPSGVLSKRCPGFILPSTKTVLNRYFRMYRTFAYPELLCRPADGGVVFYDKFPQPCRPVVYYIVRHKNTPCFLTCFISMWKTKRLVQIRGFPLRFLGFSLSKLPPPLKNFFKNT